VEPSHYEFDILWQRCGDDSGDYNGDFFVSQEKDLCGSISSCEELEGDDFLDEEYARDESRTLEDLRWPNEYMNNVENFNKQIPGESV
jgi:hypothetical protein